VSRYLTSIVGASSSNANLTQISGSITFNNTSSVSTNIVSAGIAHLYLNNIIHTASNAYGNSIVVNNCLIVPPSNYNAVSTSYMYPDMSASNTLIYQCYLSALNIVSTSVAMINCQITNNPLNTSAKA
jgi:hypothetical protein